MLKGFIVKPVKNYPTFVTQYFVVKRKVETAISQERQIEIFPG